MATVPDIRLKVVLDASSALKGLDRVTMSMLPAKLIADLGAMVARWRMERGLSNEPASATDLAMMILSLEGIGQVVKDAYLKGTGVLVRKADAGNPDLGIPPSDSFGAVNPEWIRMEVPDAASQEQGSQEQAGRQA